MGYMKTQKKMTTYLLAILMLLLTFSLICYPQVAFEASFNGLKVWWDIVFPALFPFFVLSQILIGLGVVHFLGVLLEPVMRPVFNVPGSGAFVMAMGLASGFPIGAVLTGKLRKQSLCNKAEGERLICFVNTADPLFMFGAVAVGMMGSPEAGITIAISHYLSTIIIGVMMRFYRIKERSSTSKNHKEFILKKAFIALEDAREKDRRPFGQLLGDAIQESIQTQLLIGGFIMLFSVIIAILHETGAVGFISFAISQGLEFLGLSSQLAPALISGFFEIDLGCQIAGKTPVSLEEQIIIVNVIIAWSGLSVHAQVASIISSTDLSIIPYTCTRFIHALLAGVCASLLLGPLSPVINDITRIIVIPVSISSQPQGTFFFWISRTLLMSRYLAISIIILLCISTLAAFLKKKIHPD